MCLLKMFYVRIPGTLPEKKHDLSLHIPRFPWLGFLNPKTFRKPHILVEGTLFLSLTLTTKNRRRMHHLNVMMQEQGFLTLVVLIFVVPQK